MGSQAQSRREQARWTKVHPASLKSKRAANRPKDRAVLEVLQATLDEKAT
jgi:hypothetical protein